MGYFIVCEGIDASGKATQTELLKKHFESLGGLNVTKFDLPKYDSVTGQMILDHLKGDWHVKLSDAVAVRLYDHKLLYHADPSTYMFQCCQVVNRMECLPDSLWKQGPNDVFIADRYNTSAFAYGLAMGVDLAWSKRIHRHLPQADLNIFLDITVDESFRRRPERRDQYEKNAKLLNDVREAYLSIFDEMGPSYVVVDASGTIEQTAQRIVSVINSMTDGVVGKTQFSQSF